MSKSIPSWPLWAVLFLNAACSDSVAPSSQQTAEDRSVDAGELTSHDGAAGEGTVEGGAIGTPPPDGAGRGGTPRPDGAGGSEAQSAGGAGSTVLLTPESGISARGGEGAAMDAGRAGTLGGGMSGGADGGSAPSVAHRAEADAGGAGDGTGGSPSGSGGSGGGSGPWMIFDGEDTLISAADNALAIEGTFFVFQDSIVDGEEVPNEFLHHTSLTPKESFTESTYPCVTGQVGAVRTTEGTDCDPEGGAEPCDWQDVYGGGIGVPLNGGLPWDAVHAGVEGFSFETSGTLRVEQLQFSAKMSESDELFCVRVPVVGVGNPIIEQIRLEDLIHNCDGLEPATMSLDTRHLQELRWLLVSQVKYESSIDRFCIEEIGAF